MNVIVDEFHQLFRIFAQFLTEIGVVEIVEELDHVIDDGIGEHTLGGVNLAILVEFLGSGNA